MTDGSMTAFNSLINSLPDAVMVLDAGDTILAVNPLLAAIFRQNAAEMVGTTAATLFPADAAVLHLTPDSARKISETALNGSFYQVVVSPLHSAEATPPGRVVLLRDITLTRRAENALLANERRYRALFENSNDAIFIIDFGLDILLANERAAALLHVPLADLLNASARAYFKPEEFASMEKGIIQLLSGDPAPVYEQTLIRADGTDIPTEVSLTLVRDASGAPLHIQSIVRDISERKHAEKSLNDRLEQLKLLRQVDEEITYSLKLDDVLLLALDAAMRLSRSDAGYIALMQEEQLRISTLLGKYPAEMLGMVMELENGIVGRVLQTRRPALLPDVLKDPDYRPDIPLTVSQMVLPLISQDKLVGILNLETARRETFNTDIFDFVQILASRIAVAADNARLYEIARHRLDETQSLYSRLSRLEQMKTDMIRIASHDLKAPVAIVEGYVELFKMDLDQFDPVYHDYFEAMGRACVRMRQMIADILSLERIQQRATGGTESLLNLTGMAYRALDEFQPAAAARQQTLQPELPPGLPALVRGDETQLYEAMTNLISNAIKYTPDGGHITVSVSLSPQEVAFKVEDTGYGIPEDRQERLFEPFYRARAEGTEQIEGTGLGLHLVKNIIERHSGTMIFKSVFGQGSTFGFTLPTAK
ncbi:MAG: PAS domain S-box protein [Anaerolineae bacterium]|jgi:PAS domain S-box-containing protein|nr:PAS domain S-box protein [Anaerolineae bacterium]